MKIGSLVECIKAFVIPEIYFHIEGYTLAVPEVGGMYVIREIRETSNGICILLEEIQNEPLNFQYYGSLEPGFDITHFRELQPPVPVDFFEQLQETEPQVLELV